MDLIKEDWLNNESRKSLILRLKDAINLLMPFIHKKKTPKDSNVGDKFYFTEEMNEVQSLLEILEIIFLHGSKIKEFQGQIALWGLLERLEMVNPPCQALRNSIGAICCVPILRTLLGKARAFIRQSLNSGSLEEVFVFFSLHIADWMNKFYYPQAIFCQKDDLSMLLSVIRSLKIFSFNCNLDNNALNTATTAIVKIISIQTNISTVSSLSSSSVSASPFTSANAGNVSPMNSAKLSSSSSSHGNANSQSRTSSFSSSQQSQSSSSSSSSAPPSSSFDSLLRSFEFGFDRLLHSVDSMMHASIPSSSSSSSESMDDLLTPPSASYRKLTPLFGSHLSELLLDESRCSHAFLQPELGTPTQIILLIKYIYHFITTPNLFRQKIPYTAIDELRKSLEMEKGIPSSSNIAIVAFVLIQWLNSLPEPLMGFDHYAAIISCSEIEDVSSRVRNLSLLLLETPWYNKSLLVMILTLLANCLLSENAAQNNLNRIAVSVLSTPFLLRPRYDKKKRYAALSQEELDDYHMVATAAGSTIIEFIIDHYDAVLLPIKEELQMKQLQLTNKCLKIRSLQESLFLPFDITSINRFDHDSLQLVYHLWNLLSHAEKVLSVNLTPSSSTHQLSSASKEGEESDNKDQTTSNDEKEKNEGEKASETKKAIDQQGETKQEVKLTDLTVMNLSPSSSDDTIYSMNEILQSKRWDVCGLHVLSEPYPLTEFNTSLGLLALKSFVTFLKK
jgi:hypothetical protein